jgi:hypothetical protein
VTVGVVAIVGEGLSGTGVAVAIGVYVGCGVYVGMGVCVGVLVGVAVNRAGS